MKPKEIEEGNKLIAEFMNHKFLNQEEYAKETYCPKEEIINMPECNLFYHCSWDELMPVVEKIESLGYDVFINGLYCRITDSGLSDFEIESSEVACKIESVFSTCVEFAEWYNNQQSK